MTSYQKLKKRIVDQQKQYDELFDKLTKIIDDPDSEESQQIRRWAILNRRFKMYSMMSLLEAISNVKPSDKEVYSWNVLDRDNVKGTGVNGQ